ncbi:MAG TPA: nucleotidyltransferase family protein [Miltoncostaea sp.]|nr:nucleotidyltransferase family protein [Miltoncostaea sp.]
MARVVGIVLGAGGSRRLGRPKQTLPLGGTTLLGQVLSEAEASRLDDVVLVLGGAAVAARAAVAPGRARVVVNDAYGEGCASSLLAGLDAAGEADAVVLVLGDMPGAGPGAIDAVRDAWEARRPWAAVADWQGTPGHPMAFAAEAFPDLRALHGDKAVWKLRDAHPERFLAVPVDGPIPRDVDTWEDYEAVRSRFG